MHTDHRCRIRKLSVICENLYYLCVNLFRYMRRKRNITRTILPDVKYNNETVAKFINYVMRDGKKSIAQKVVYKTFGVIEKDYKQDPLAVFDLAVRNVSPLVEVKARRVGGANYQVPREVRGPRKLSLAFRWILQSARVKKGKAMALRLADELIAASKNEGNAVKKRADVHRMAEANKAFAHFSW